MKQIALGSQGLKVSQIGFGCMGLTTAYGTKLPDEEIVSLLKTVYDRGITLWDTANLYMFYDPSRIERGLPPFACQEEIIEKALHQVGRENVVLATKTGIELVVPQPSEESKASETSDAPDANLLESVQLKARGDPAFIRKQCEDSLARLKTDYIDLFYLHRIDQNIPIEISMLEMKKLVEEGKIRHVGLSECSAATIRRAHKVFPLTAVQLEYSLWCRGIEDQVLETCKELGIGLVAYAPLGRGFFGGAAKKQFDKDDFRSNQERMTGEAGKRHAEMLEKIEQIAEKKGVSTAQLALAWVQAQQSRTGGAGVVPIPGTTKVRNLESNVASTEVELSEEELDTLEAAFPHSEVEGSRYNDGVPVWENDKNPPLSAEQAREYGLE